jgi:hypothetical protein
MAATAKAANATRKAPVATKGMRILSFLDGYATQKAFSYLENYRKLFTIGFLIVLSQSKKHSMTEDRELGKIDEWSSKDTSSRRISADPQTTCGWL